MYHIHYNIIKKDIALLFIFLNISWMPPKFKPKFQPAVPAATTPPAPPSPEKEKVNDVDMEPGAKETEEEFNKELYDPTKRTSPIKSIEEKWKLLPAFLKVKGLVKQHLDSFNYFTDVELKKILEANKRITIDEYDDFFLEYLDIRVQKPDIIDTGGLPEKITPHECRLRDLTYSAPIHVDVRYTCQNQIIVKRNIEIGRIPIMLGSNKCLLYNMSHAQLMKHGECPHDPGGYFIVRGTEKVILIHEQISKNRIILEVSFISYLTPCFTSFWLIMCFFHCRKIPKETCVHLSPVLHILVRVKLMCTSKTTISS